MENVFVVSDRHYESRKAEIYGKLIYLSAISMPKMDTDKMFSQFNKILQEHSQQEDYILLSGLSVMNSIATSIFAVKWVRLNLLIHDSRNDRYVVRRIYFA